MDSKQLIVCVSKRPILWDNSHESYKNRELTRQLWTEVAREMESQSGAVKTKWRGLRDTFRRELKKANSLQAKGIHSHPSWPFYDNMAFLAGGMAVPTGPHKVEVEIEEDHLGNNSRWAESDADDDVKRFRRVHFQHEPEKGAEEDLGAVDEKEPRGSKRKRGVDESEVGYSNPCFDTENDDEDNDGDYHFLMSLLPFIKSIPRSRKMVVRLKLQQVLCEEEGVSERGSTNAKCAKSSVLKAIVATGSENMDNLEKSRNVLMVGKSQGI
ncbi:unnamed protein product [Timema podura]|uniref:MADF domain-containing protein n=1 Tax=Timema podura TaxID=61482 RepID=A0ABN7P961_TIMPD|nr:unnamed protein product [Timema podura]